MRALASLERIVRWYAARAYGRWEGPGCVPFYCDPGRVGRFAVRAEDLAAGREEALFRLLVTMSMYQSRRDVDIMALQYRMPASSAAELTQPSWLGRVIARSRCEQLATPERFDEHCSVTRDAQQNRASCAYRPRTTCHVKHASLAIGRMGDMGKIPTSAWLHLNRSGGFAGLLEAATSNASSPAEAADVIVRRLAELYKIGVKLATMFVSALATPALAPGLTPWWPAVEGNHLVVVDANVGRVIDQLRRTGPKTYEARARWFRKTASRLDLQQVRPDWPTRSPRLVQQAVYWFRSRSNRTAMADRCAAASSCELCVPGLCPFGPAH